MMLSMEYPTQSGPTQSSHLYTSDNVHHSQLGCQRSVSVVLQLNKFVLYPVVLQKRIVILRKCFQKCLPVIQKQAGTYLPGNWIEHQNANCGSVTCKLYIFYYALQTKSLYQQRQKSSTNWKVLKYNWNMIWPPYKVQKCTLIISAWFHDWLKPLTESRKTDVTDIFTNTTDT